MGTSIACGASEATIREGPMDLKIVSKSEKVVFVNETVKHESPRLHSNL